MITIDDYYDVNFYNECLNALKNNSVNYTEYVSTKPPYKWYISLENNVKPVMINYDEIPSSEKRFLITKTKPLRANEEYLLTRRNDSIGAGAIKKYTTNDSLPKDTDFVVYFNAVNKEQMLKLSSLAPFKIFYLGKYYSNKYKVMLCSNSMILNYIDRNDILYQHDGNISDAEALFNFKVLRGNDYIDKYTETPYFLDGKYYQGNIKGEKNASVRYNI